MSKLFYCDLETTGTNENENGIIQIAGIVEIDGKVEDKINLTACPFDDDVITDKALEVNGRSREEIAEFDNPTFVKRDLIVTLDSYVDRYDKRDKFFFVGYNATFDDSFLRAFFKKLNDNYYGSWFYWPPIGVQNLAVMHLMDRREDLYDFKLGTIAKEILGEENVDSSRTHDAFYDIVLTRQIFKELDHLIRERREYVG